MSKFKENDVVRTTHGSTTLVVQGPAAPDNYFISAEGTVYADEPFKKIGVFVPDPKPVTVGCKATAVNYGWPVTVLAIDGKYAWIKDVNGLNHETSLANLKVKE